MIIKKKHLWMCEREQDNWVNEKCFTPRCPSSLSLSLSLKHTHTHTHYLTHTSRAEDGDMQRWAQKMCSAGQSGLINRGGNEQCCTRVIASGQKHNPASPASPSF